MSDTLWIEAVWMETIEFWRNLPEEKRRCRHREAIPRRVAYSMAMEGESVDEAWIRERLVRRIPPAATSKLPSAS